MNIFVIDSTPFREDDFHLMTTLSAKEISCVIRPIVKDKRKIDAEYNSETIVSALKRRYPTYTIEPYTEIKVITV